VTFFLKLVLFSLVAGYAVALLYWGLLAFLFNALGAGRLRERLHGMHKH
jgi:hypothetical protein